MKQCSEKVLICTLFFAFLISGCGKEEKNPFLESVLIEQLVVKPRASAAELDKTKEKAEKTLEQLKSGADFSELAREHSTHKSASQGGELTITKGWMDPAFDQAVLAMEDSSLSGTIETPEALYIVYRDYGRYLQQRSSHILLMPDKDLEGEARERDLKELEKKAWELRRRILEGESFYDLAREHSDDEGSAQKGGDIGWHKRNTLAREYEEVTFNQDLGELSEPMQTSFGWHIIRTVQKKDLSLKLKIIEFKPEITDADRSRARKILEEARRQAAAGLPLAQLPERFALSQDGALTFNEKYMVRKNLMVPELAEQMENMDEGDVSGIVESQAGFYFVRLLEKD